MNAVEHSNKLLKLQRNVEIASCDLYKQGPQSMSLACIIEHALSGRDIFRGVPAPWNEISSRALFLFISAQKQFILEKEAAVKDGYHLTWVEVYHKLTMCDEPCPTLTHMLNRFIASSNKEPFYTVFNTLYKCPQESINTCTPVHEKISYIVGKAGEMPKTEIDQALQQWVVATYNVVQRLGCLVDIAKELNKLGYAVDRYDVDKFAVQHYGYEPYVFNLSYTPDRPEFQLN